MTFPLLAPVPQRPTPGGEVASFYWSHGPGVLVTVFPRLQPPPHTSFTNGQNLIESLHSLSPLPSFDTEGPHFWRLCPGDTGSLNLELKAALVKTDTSHVHISF